MNNEWEFIYAAINAALDVALERGFQESERLMIEDLEEDRALQSAELAGPVFDPRPVIMRNDAWNATCVNECTCSQR